MASETFGFHTTGAEVVRRFADRVRGRTFMITGPTPGGIGAAAVLELSKASPYMVVLAGRDEAKLGQLVKQLQETAPAVRIILVKLDLGSLASVRAAARSVLENSEIAHIDVLINNAAIMASPHMTTADGIEAQFGTNHIGHFLLTNLLKPKLAGGRIVSVSSSAHHFSTGDFTDYNFEHKDYNRFEAYGNGKIANVLFATALAARGVEAYSLHPGSIVSNLQRYMQPEDREEAIKVMLSVNPTFDLEPRKTLEEGCATHLVAALDPSLPNGEYLVNCAVSEAKPEGRDKQKAEQLWELSEQIVGESFSW